MPAPSPQVEHFTADLVAKGASLAWVAKQLGIPDRTMRGWASDGRPGHRRYERFAESIQDARLEHQRTLEALAEQLRRRVA